MRDVLDLDYAYRVLGRQPNQTFVLMRRLNIKEISCFVFAWLPIKSTSFGIFGVNFEIVRVESLDRNVIPNVINRVRVDI